MNNKIKYLVAIVAAAAFVSCSSGGGATAPAQVASYTDLGKCSSYNEGVTKQVASDGQYYKCVAGEWQETDASPKSSASNSRNEDKKQKSGTLTGNILYDSRDGHTYKTVTIGTQTWMAQNLNYKTSESYCFDDASANCALYGRLYSWSSAKSACPAGWHLPSIDEFEVLEEQVGGSGIAGKVLKSKAEWNGTDDYGFDALPVGYRRANGEYSKAGTFTNFWSSTKCSSKYPSNSNCEVILGMTLRSRDDETDHWLDGFVGAYFSVRCVKD